MHNSPLCVCLYYKIPQAGAALCFIIYLAFEHIEVFHIVEILIYSNSGKAYISGYFAAGILFVAVFFEKALYKA